MLRMPTVKTIRTVAVILVSASLAGHWLWSIQRDCSFVSAAETGNVSKVRAGLNSGIDPNKAQMKGETALRFAMVSRRRERADIVRLLLDREANPNDGMYLAVATQQADMVQLLIAKGADVNPKLCCGDGSLLLVAAQTKDNKVIHLLKAAGARK